MNTNLFLITLIVTNWVNTSDFKRENGSNYFRMRAVIETNTYVAEVMLCTNLTLIKRSDSGTNGVLQWRLQSSPPALPGARARE
jgi:hypothetical protein